MFVIENVRLIPNATIGKLTEEDNVLYWVNSETQTLIDINVSDCESILIDELSSTAIFSSQKMGIKMIHFINTEDMYALVQYLEQLELFTTTGETTNNSYVQFTSRKTVRNDDLDEATLNLLEAFSKVPLMAKSLISKLKGEPDYLHRPRGIRSTAIPRNPWIIDKPIELPACRMKFDVEERGTQEWSQLPEHLKPRIIYNSAGKILNPETRRLFWLSVLKTENTDNTENSMLNSSILDAEAVSRIEKDLYRLGEADQTVLTRLEAILKDYSLIDPQLSYVQGMADLALPFSRLFDNHADAFACFKALMKRLRSNFIDNDGDEFGMQNQLKMLRDLIEDFSPLLSDYLKFNRDTDSLFFAYRWLLVLFRREFQETERLWDVMFAAQCCDIASIEEFRIYVALAMIMSQKSQFVKTCSRFEDVLKVQYHLQI